MSSRELVLENDVIKAVFLPHDGGRLVSLVYKPCSREFFWTNPRTSRLDRYYGANYDNLSAGGLEEAFPSGFGDSYDGYEIPFFGEVWTTEWQYEEYLPYGLAMEALCSIYPVSIKKEWTVRNDTLECVYEIKNLSKLELPYLFGIHPSLRIEAGDELHLPDGSYQVGEIFPQGVVSRESFIWPVAGERDLKSPPHEDSCEYIQVYTEKTTEGALKIGFGNGNGQLTIRYDNDYFSSLSVWMIYGGWRGHRCIMAEFFTGWPLILSEAVERNNHALLTADEIVKTTVTYQITPSK